MSSVAELTAKQARFIDEFLVDGNGAGAAVRAGYSPSGAHVTASRMLRNATPVARAIQARQASDATRLSLRREDVLAGLLMAVATAREQRNPAAMISGLREVAKMLGFYPANSVKVDVSVTADVHSDRINQLSDADLMKIIEAGGVLV